MPVAPLELPTLSPVEFHLPPWLGGPPDVDDDTAAQATNNSSNIDYDTPLSETDKSGSTSTPISTSNTTDTTLPSLSAPAQSHNASVLSGVNSTFSLNLFEDNTSHLINETESEDERRRKIGAMLDAFIREDPAVNRVTASKSFPSKRDTSTAESRVSDPEWLRNHPSYVAEIARKEK